MHEVALQANLYKKVGYCGLGTGPAQDLVLVFPRSCTRIATKILYKILFGLFWLRPRFTKTKIWNQDLVQDLVWVKSPVPMTGKTRSCFGFPKILYKNCDQDLVQDLVW